MEENNKEEKNKKMDVENKVMSEIKSGRVKLRSKYLFLAEKMGMGSVLVLSILLAVLLFNLFFFYLKASDNLAYLSFGHFGIFAFLESFPYLLVVSLIVLIFVAGFIIRKSDISYKKPFGYFAIALVGFIMIAGGVLAFTDIAERIERQSYDDRRPAGMLFRPFLRPGLGDRQGGVAGRVVEVGEDYINLQTPVDIERIDLRRLERQVEGVLHKDMFVVAIGERRGEIFEARMLRIVEEGGMPMIRRGVRIHSGF